MFHNGQGTHNAEHGHMFWQLFAQEKKTLHFGNLNVWLVAYAKLASQMKIIRSFARSVHPQSFSVLRSP